MSHEKNVVTKAAYLLFYRRREVFIPPQLASPSEVVVEEEAYACAGSEISEESQSNDDFRKKSNLIIEISQTDDLDLPDLEDIGTDSNDKKESIVEVPVISMDDDNSYRDMDSVD